MRQKILMPDQKPFLLRLRQQHLEQARCEWVKAGGGDPAGPGSKVRRLIPGSTPA